MKVAVSFLKSNTDFDETLQKIENSHADIIHVDVADGLFVNNKTIFNKEKLEILKKCQKPKEVHLMTLHSKGFIDCFSYINPKTIILSYEAVTNLEKEIFYIKDKGIGVGIAINPFTDVDKVRPFINVVDEILVLSVIPGYGGQKFIATTVDRIEKLSKLREEYHAKFLINVDGGIDAETISLIRDKIDIAVSGSFICESADYDSKIKELQN